MVAPVRDLRGKRCLITGAASGIGRATAQAAARKGALLYLTDVQAAPLAELTQELRSAGWNVEDASALDLTDFEAVRAYAQQLHSTHGSMDVVMNIAGISVWGSVDQMQHHHWRKLVEVNLMGPIHIIESFIPEMMRAGRGGQLVNVASAAALFGLPWHAGYSASKFGLRGISEVLRFDLARYGIGVSLVCPGAVSTPLVSSVEVLGVDTHHAAVEELRARFQRHAVSPEQAAAAILRGIERNQWLVFTSADIRIGHWFQRKLSLPYELAMKMLNDRLHRVALLAKRAAPAPLELRGPAESRS